MGWSNTPNYGFGAPKQNTQWAPLNPLGGGGGGGGSNQVQVVNGQLQQAGGGGSQPDAGGTLRNRIFGEYQKQLNTYNQGVQTDQRSIEQLLGGRGVNIPQPGNMPGQQPLGQPQRGIGGQITSNTFGGPVSPVNPQASRQAQQQQQVINAGGSSGGINGQGILSPERAKKLQEAIAAGNQTGTAMGGYGGGFGISQNQWGGGNMTANSPLYSPQASFVMADNARRGLGGTTAGQNQVVLSNSLALADKGMQDQRLQMDAQQQQYAQGADQQRFQESQNQFALQRGDNLTRDAVSYYKERNSIPPDISPLLQMAQMEGQGATDGMQQPQSGGWGGGGFMSGYNIPQGAWGAQGAYYQEPQQGQQMSAQEQLASVQDQQRTAAANRDLRLTLMGQQQEQISNMPGTAQARARAQRQFNQQWGG